MSDDALAASLLTEIAETRRSTQATAVSLWYPMVVFGLVAVGGGVLTFAGNLAQMVWWAVGVFGGLLLVARFYRRRCASVGLVSRHHRYRPPWPISPAVESCWAVAC